MSNSSTTDSAKGQCLSESDERLARAITGNVCMEFMRLEGRRSAPDCEMLDSIGSLVRETIRVERESPMTEICPTCHGRKVIVPFGYAGEPWNCPTCTKQDWRDSLPADDWRRTMPK